jgi:hypothetical protein
MRPDLFVACAALALSVPCSAALSPAAFEARILALHNRERSTVALPPLAWDDALAAGAAVWAEHMAATGEFEHSDRHARRGIGENIWTGPRSIYSIDAAVGLWTGEKRRFVPGTYPNVSRAGWYAVSHYTQVIWPKTTRVGCAFASNARSDYLVCRYSPVGNIDGVWVP